MAQSSQFQDSKCHPGLYDITDQAKTIRAAPAFGE